MSGNKPKILLFARGYQAGFYPYLVDEAYEAVFVTLTKAEKREVEVSGQEVVACFEEDLAGIQPASVPDEYLCKSLPADRFLGRFGHADRLDFLGREITFWRQLLDTHQPVAVMNEIVAVEISEVLYIEARTRDIRYLAPMRSLITDWFYWIPNPISLSGSQLTSIEPSADSMAKAESYMGELCKTNYRPGYVRNLSRRYAPKPLAAALIKYLPSKFRGTNRYEPASFAYETYSEAYGKRLEVAWRGVRDRYDCLEDIPEAREILLYPLHQEPEATLNYMSEFFSNQVATIENILKAMSPNQVLLVKEHPVDKGALLTTKFRRLREEHSALFYLPGELSGRAIQPRLSRVVTLTSTVGWEMANLGIPLYVLGEIFFDSLPGVTRIETFKELRNQLRAPVADAPRLQREVATRFVAELIERSYPGDALPFAGLKSDQNVERVKHAIRDALGLQR